MDTVPLANFLFAIQMPQRQISLKEPLYLFKESHEESPEEPPKETSKTFKIDARSLFTQVSLYKGSPKDSLKNSSLLY